MNNIWKNIVESYLIRDTAISEIQANGTTSLFVRKNGKRIEIPNVFANEEEYTKSIQVLIKMINADARDSARFLEEGRLRLPNNGIARVHIVLPPVSDYPQVTIAKKTQSLTDIDKIYEYNSISMKMRNFLKAAIDCKLTIVFSGSTGAGKTTMLEALTKLIPPTTRIGVIEDSPELSLIQPNVTYLHSHPWKPGMDPNEEVTLDWCTKQINRMRTDLIVIGETRGKEFYEFITAANSGMNGSLTTLHSNSPKLAIQKMTQFIMIAQPQPVRVANTSIMNTIDLIVQLDKTLDGEYKCTEIAEVTGPVSNNEDALISIATLTKYNPMTKTWDDKFMISDKLRATLISKGYNPMTFVKEKMGMPQL